MPFFAGFVAGRLAGLANRGVTARVTFSAALATVTGLATAAASSTASQLRYPVHASTSTAAAATSGMANHSA